MKIGILASAVGLAVSAAALAEATRAPDLIPISKSSLEDPQIQIYKQVGFPRLDDGIVGERRTSPVNGGRDLLLRSSRNEGVTQYVDPRGGVNVITAQSDFELAPANTSIATPGVIFGTSFTSGMVPPNLGWNLRGQSVTFTRVIDPSLGDPLTQGPATGTNGVASDGKMLRHRVGAPQAAGQFFFGSSMRLVVDTVQAGMGDYTTFPIAPTADSDAVLTQDVYNTSIATLETFEPIGFTGFIAGRILWGGTEDDPESSLPLGPITQYFSLGPNPASFQTGIFVACTICEDVNGNPIAGCVPPAGTNIGDPVPIILNNWHTMIGTTTPDGRFTAGLDRLDGNPPFEFYSNVLLTAAFLDRVGNNASFEADGIETFFDNVDLTGEPFILPTAPALECVYVDDTEWLNGGPVLGQTARYFVALSSALVVINQGAQGQVLSQTNNVSESNEYRQEWNTAMPSSFATAGDPWSLCMDVRTTLGTVRGFAPDSEVTNFVAGGVTTRVYLGREDPFDMVMPFYENSVYVQINIEYDPTDVEGGPNPQDNVPIIGTDIADTGFNWDNNGVFRELCMTVDVDNALTVSVAGNNIYSGSAFSNAANLMRFESENNTFGTGSQLNVDDLTFACSALPEVTLPALTLDYLDNIEWGVIGLPPNRHIDDPMTSPTASTRYTNANGVVIGDDSFLRGVSGNVVAMQNVFTDTPQIAPPDINGETAFLFVQFTTETPNVTVDATTAWIVEMEWAMSDFFTSRGFSPAQNPDVGDGFELGGYLWYAAPNDTFYLFGSIDGATAADDLVNIDTGITRSSLGITENTPFTVRAEYNLVTDKIDWSVNGTLVGSTNPIVGTDDGGNDRIQRNLDAILVWGGDDDTAPQFAPFSTLYVDNITVSTGAVECPGDSNGDGIVNFTDLNAVLATFGQSGPGLPGDVDGNNIVNFADLNLVLANFGTNCN
jgi:hypothetical protein